jgi:hypothetical protein
MVLAGQKTKNIKTKTKSLLQFDHGRQPRREAYGDRDVWYRYELIRERLALKPLLHPVETTSESV